MINGLPSTDTRILTIANQKGGVGKTTTTINLGTALAAVGERVLIIDVDPQGNASTGLGIDRGTRRRSTYHVLTEATALAAVTIETSIPRLSVAPSTLDLLGAELELAALSNRAKILRGAIETLLAEGTADSRGFAGVAGLAASGPSGLVPADLSATHEENDNDRALDKSAAHQNQNQNQDQEQAQDQDHDHDQAPVAGKRPRPSYILIDCPPSLNLLTVNALSAADAVLVPLQCEFFALEGLTQLLNTVEQIQNHLNPRLHVQGIVLTMFDRRNKLSEQVASDVRQHFGSLVYDTVIPRNVRISEAPSHGKPVLLYDLNCAGSQSYLRLASEIIRRERQESQAFRGDHALRSAS